MDIFNIDIYVKYRWKRETGGLRSTVDYVIAKKFKTIVPDNHRINVSKYTEPREIREVSIESNTAFVIPIPNQTNKSNYSDRL